MLPWFCLVTMQQRDHSTRKKAERWTSETEMKLRHMQYSVPFDRKPGEEQTKFGLRSDSKNRNEEIKAKKKRDMTSKVSNLSDLIQRVTASCLLHPLSRGGEKSEDRKEGSEDEEDDFEDYEDYRDVEGGEEEEDDEKSFKFWEEEEKRNGMTERVKEMESMMTEVFESISSMKRAYVSLQEAHCPWDPEKMRVADVGVVAELRRLGRFRERFRRGGGVGKGGLVREGIVGPYEAAVEELKREVKAREAEVDNLKEKLKSFQLSGKKGRSHRKVSCSQARSIPSCPTTELFEFGMHQVKHTLKAFTALLLTLMRSARWDIAAAVRSIEGTALGDDAFGGVDPSPRHAKHALESYVSLKIFQGFENETFYIDGSLSSLLHPEKFRQDCFAQYRDMKAMDPAEILGILPSCHFGKFCCKKFLAIVHPKMEESLFGNLEHRRAVLAGSHPRSEFYGMFLGVAKAVWLLHLLAFALDPAPSHFQASRGVEFHPEYMESVVRYAGSGVPAGQIVGFPVTPGFKLGNGSVIKARVYLVSRV
ncbi:protein GRAVITROPIC IN THE LIGHT 1-like isoform X2 [Aristolochia californica]|uniref:protein GRAVITROPIC IN THE LIGHT 1-like isoform X2 n=1 Tax=Aristolochia californica TaxID=171875 RepID=UPI0035D827BA